MGRLWIAAVLIVTFGIVTPPASGKAENQAHKACTGSTEETQGTVGVKAVTEAVTGAITGAITTTASYLLTAAGYAVDGTAYLLVPAVTGSLLCMVPAVELARAEDRHWGTGQFSGLGGMYCFQEVLNRLDSRTYVPQLGKRAFKATARWRCY